MKFAQAQIEKGKLWLGCKESKVIGASSCINEITEYYNGKQTNEPWCAKFVWMVVDLTTKDFGIKNLLPKSASTLQMVNTASKKGLRVDGIPANGSVFFKTRDGGGHVGFVSSINSNRELITLEGNSNDQVQWGKHKNWLNYKFIHTEEMPTRNGKADEGSITSELPGLVYNIYAGLPEEALYVGAGMLGLASLGGIWYFSKK